MRQILTKRSLLPLALLGAAAALFVLPPRAAAEAESLAAPAPRPVPVRALRPEAVEGRLEVQRYTGTIQARRESELGFERAGNQWPQSNPHTIQHLHEHLEETVLANPKDK